MFFRRPQKKKRKRALRLHYTVIGACISIGTLIVAGVAVFQYVEAYQAKINAPIPVAIDPNLGIKPYVEEFFVDNDAAEMLPIIACESRFKHFDKDGGVLKNTEGSSAIGVAQILTSKHPDQKVLFRYNKRNNTDLTASDFDLNTLQGNLGYALVLYKVRGTRDWECARKVQ